MECKMEQVMVPTQESQVHVNQDSQVQVGHMVEPASILEAILPFEPDDGQKGTFLVLRVAGMVRAMALKLVNRKYRSWQHWRSTDEDFYRLDEAIPQLANKFAGEARVIRTALLDISIIETGVYVFGRILKKEAVSSDMWAYATKLAGLRMPMMGAKEDSSSPWERLANSIHNTMATRELSVKEVDMYGREKMVTAREVVGVGTIQPSLEQKQMAQEIVGQILARRDGQVSDDNG